MLRLATLIAAVSILFQTVMGGQITIKGSDSMVRLCQRWAEEYMKYHKQTVIQVTGGGSSAGIAALINGSTKICASSRPMSVSEAQTASVKGIRVHSQVVGIDAITVYLNKRNPVGSLTLDQLRLIYTDILTNWKDLGGTDQPIILYGRENNSGTFTYFQQHILGGEDFADRCEPLPGTAAVVHAVANDINGIGYGSIAWATTIKYAGIKTNDSTVAILPSVATIADGSYPISRELYFFLNGEPTGETREFLDWVLSTDGQKITSQAGYVPVKGQ
jgi:phosphate transport system substrate-binding protein